MLSLPVVAICTNTDEASPGGVATRSAVVLTCIPEDAANAVDEVIAPVLEAWAADDPASVTAVVKAPVDEASTVGVPASAVEVLSAPAEEATTAELPAKVEGAAAAAAHIFLGVGAKI